jgi:outer membrane protein assembly factor BamB
MSATEVPAARRGGAFFRVWLPLLILALAATAVALLWSVLKPEWDRGVRIFNTELIVVGTGLLLLLWLLCFSGLRWWLRVGTVLVLAGAAFGTIRSVEVTGDMEPVVHFRWSRTPAELLEAHRRQHGPSVAPMQAAAAAPRATDYPEYRNRQRDGIVTGPALARDWKTNPPRQLWRQPVGGGYASFALVGDAAVTIEQRREDEAVVCYDTATGQERWAHAYLAFFTERLGGDGPRATPTIAGGDVYALGATGRLTCLDLVSGQPRWSVEILDNDPKNNIPWGMSGSPLVYDQVVVVNPGKQTEAAAGRALVAYDRATGKPIWSGGETRAGYSSPMLATLAGRRQVLLFDGEELGGYDAADGSKLWRLGWTTHMGINVAQPLVLEGDRVFISSGYSVGCALVQIAEAGGQWTAQPLWKNTLMRCKFTSPVARAGYLYGLDDGVLVCLDQHTGDRKWKGGRYGHGQLLLSDDLLVILSESGKLVLVEATPEGHRELGSIAALDGKTWNHLALADGKAYVRNHREMACYDLSERKGP